MTLSQKLCRAGGTSLACAASLAVLAVANGAAARRAERRHPPQGRFITVDGVRLHYTDRGSGTAIVLIHGNAVAGDDFEISGLAELLAPTHRIISFDRPGCGYSERPRGRIWSANAQADLIHAAVEQLAVQRPILVGHSFGAIVALAYAVRHAADTSGLVLLSGYYFWTLRPDVLLVAPGAIPGFGDILRYTVAPLIGWLGMSGQKRAMFSPAPVPVRFQAEFSPSMSLRPSQIHATSVDGALMIPAVLSLRSHYRQLSMPVAIMAGDGDRIVSDRSAKRLHERIPGSRLHIVKGAGHMIHHLVPHHVAEVIETVAQAGPQPAAARLAATPAREDVPTAA
jgi:pimeloyl-ACP methyl ester carboxylesterase